MVHPGEEARFTLHLLDQAEAALTLAQENWAIEREPIDARLLLEASLAARKVDAATPILNWLEKTRLEDVHLSRLRSRLQAAHETLVGSPSDQSQPTTRSKAR